MPASRRALTTLAAATAALALAACGSPSGDPTGDPNVTTSPATTADQPEAANPTSESGGDLAPEDAALADLQAALATLPSDPGEAWIQEDSGSINAEATLVDADGPTLAQVFAAWEAAGAAGPEWSPDSTLRLSGMGSDGGEAFQVTVTGWPEPPSEAALATLPELYNAAAEAGNPPLAVMYSHEEGELAEFSVEYLYDLETDWYPQFLAHLAAASDAATQLGTDPQRSRLLQNYGSITRVPLGLAGQLDDPAWVGIFEAIADTNATLMADRVPVSFIGCVVQDGPEVGCWGEDVDAGADEEAVAALRATVEAAGVAWAGE